MDCIWKQGALRREGLVTSVLRSAQGGEAQGRWQEPVEQGLREEKVSQKLMRGFKETRVELGKSQWLAHLPIETRV